VNGKAAKVTSNPATIKFFRNYSNSSAAHEAIQDKVALVTRCLQDSFQQSFRFLRWIFDPFLAASHQRMYIRPNVLEWDATHLVKISLIRRDAVF